MLKKGKFLAILLIIPFFNSCNNRTYNIKLKQESKALTLEHLNFKLFDENDNLILDSFTSNEELDLLNTNIFYYIDISYKGSFTNKNTDNYSFYIKSPSNVVSEFEIEEASTINYYGGCENYTNGIKISFSSTNKAKNVDDNFRIRLKFANSNTSHVPNLLFSVSYENIDVSNLNSNIPINPNNYEVYTNRKQKYIKFGAYPQSKASGVEIVPYASSCYSYNGNYYSNYNNEAYKVEPILWRVIDETDFSYILLSEYILDTISSTELFEGFSYSYSFSLFAMSLNYDKNICALLDNVEKGISNEKYISDDEKENKAYATDYAKAKGLETKASGVASYWIKKRFEYTSGTFIFKTKHYNYYYINEKGKYTVDTFKSVENEKLGMRPFFILNK